VSDFHYYNSIQRTIIATQQHRMMINDRPIGVHVGCVCAYVCSLLWFS